jgi:hypothetical protein
MGDSVMKKLALAIAVVGALCSFTAFGQEAKGLTGVEVPLDTIANVAPNTVLLIMIDENRKIHTVKVDHDSIPKGESLVRVASGCWVYIGGQRVWKNPCPY